MKGDLCELALTHSVDALYLGGTVQWSADGNIIYATCGSVIKVFNIEDCQVKLIIGDADCDPRITCFILTNDSTLIVAYSSTLIRQYYLTSDSGQHFIAEIKQQWKSTHTSPILTMESSPTGAYLATGSADFTVKIWKIESRLCVGALKRSSAIGKIIFPSDEDLIVGEADGTVSCYSMKRLKKVQFELKVHTSAVVFIGKLNETLLASASRDQTLVLINMQTKEIERTLPLFEPVECAVLNDDGLLYTVGEEGILKCWQPYSAKLQQSAHLSKCRIDQILHNRCRKQLLLATSDYNLFVVDSLSMNIKKQMIGFNDEIFDLSFVGKNKKHIAVAANSSAIRIYNLNTWSCQLINGHDDSILCLSTAKWNLDWLASCSKDNSIIIWEFNFDCEMQCEAWKLAYATGHTDNVTAVRFSSMSKSHFLLSVSNDSTIKLWSLADITSMSRSEKLIASSTFVAHKKDITCVDLSVNDRLCVTGSMDKTARLWHIDSEKMQLGSAGVLSGHRRGVWDVKFSTNTETVITSCGDCMIRLFSLAKCECLMTLVGHDFAVLRVISINNGKQIMSCDGAGLIKVWSVARKDCISTVEGHSDKIWSLLPSADESQFITAGSEGCIKVWNDISEQKLEEEHQKLIKRTGDEQILTNLVQEGDYSKAMEYALALVRPLNCFKIIELIIDRDVLELRKTVSSLPKDLLTTLLDFISQWNTNSRTSNVSQRVLYDILHCFDPEYLLNFPDFPKYVEALLPYTERHFERLSRARTHAAFLNYAWSQTRMI